MEEIKKVIMNPQHPKWDEFCERLEGVEGCNFKKKGKKYTWYCSGDDKSKAISILITIPNIDIEGSIKYFEETGGHCDCEIVLNTMKKLNKYIKK